MVYLPSASLALGLLASVLSTTNALTARAGAIEPAILPGNADAQGFYFKTEKVNKTSDVPADGLYANLFSLDFKVLQLWPNATGAVVGRMSGTSVQFPSSDSTDDYQMTFYWNVRGSPDILVAPLANHTGDWEYMTPSITLQDGRLDIGSKYMFVACELGLIGQPIEAFSLEFRPIPNSWVEPTCTQVNLLTVQKT